MRILAFDQATRKSGVSYSEYDELKYCGLLDCNNVYNSKERFHEMVKLLVGKIDEIQPDIVVFEDVDSSFGNVETIRLLPKCRELSLASVSNRVSPIIFTKHRSGGLDFTFSKADT